MKLSKYFKRNFSTHSANKLRKTRIFPYFLALACLADRTQSEDAEGETQTRNPWITNPVL